MSEQQAGDKSHDGAVEEEKSADLPSPAAEQETGAPSNGQGEAGTEKVEVAATDAPEVEVDAEHAKDEKSAEEPAKRNLAPSPVLVPTAAELNAPHPAEALHPPDSPTTSLISSLRSQLLSLSDQTHALNSKLIASISRSADLEDEFTVLREQHQELGVKAKALEEERDRWENSMKTGLLVERDQIRDEMQRLAAGLVEEERRRGSAEEKREQVENEVDDLTAKLFDQANTMVATERMSRAQAEARLKSTEENLANAEAAVQAMQLQLQTLSTTALAPAPATPTRRSLPAAGPAVVRKYVASHVPYSEFLTFLQHLRALRPIGEVPKQTFPPPALTNMLAQPFFARAIVEDHDPTLRLDTAPDLSWLSRRSVANAIISGDLVIEPVSPAQVLASTGSAMGDIGCSLCGKRVFVGVPPSPAGAGHFGTHPPHPQRNSGSSSSRFSLKPFFATTTTSSPSQPAVSAPSPAASPLSSPALPSNSAQTSIYIFRIARTQPGTTDKDNAKLYPLCRSGWCLERMRATCELWHFVRTGIVHVVWHGDDGSPEAGVTSITSSNASESIKVPEEALAVGASSSTTDPVTAAATHIEPPPLPSRKKSWGLGFNKSGSSWTKGWGVSSGPASPGEKAERGSVGSVGAERDEKDERSEKDEKEVLAPSGTDTPAGQGLGEALELDEKKEEVAAAADDQMDKLRQALEAEEGLEELDKAEEEQEQKQEQREESGEAVTKETSAPGSPSLKPPSLKRGNSTASNPNSDLDDGASFSTPKGVDQELPATDEAAPAVHDDSAAGEERAEKTEEDEKKDNVVDLSSPVVEQSSQFISPSKATPPPVPKRAAARNRLSQIGGSASGSTASLGLLNDEAKEADESKAQEEKKVEPENAEGDEEGQVLELLPKDLDAPPGTPPAPPPPPRHPALSPATESHPPPLPPRNPHTPPPPPHRRVPSSQGAANGGAAEGATKTFLSSESGEGESWEEKTWKGVVRLKENMWKARVGVIEE